MYGQGQNSSNSSTFGYTASSQKIKNDANLAGCFAAKYSQYKPQKGDLAIWTNINDPSHGHVGIISASDSNGFWVIEGNSKNAVRKKYYRYNELPARFSGYVQMTKWLNKSSNNFSQVA